MARNPNKRIMGNRKGRGPGTTAYIVEVQGANALADHFWAIGEFYPTFAPALLEVVGELGIETARKYVPYRSGATYESINMEPGVIGKGNIGEYSIRFGPTTFYSPFLEYGTIFMAPRPFMGPAGDLAEIVTIKSVIEFIKLVDSNAGGMGFGSGSGGEVSQVLGDSRIRSPFTGIRTFLYSTSKFLGDVAVFGGRELVGPVRRSALMLGRMTGDVSSVMSGTISTRVSNRLRGRAIGHITGFGSASISFEKTYSAFPGGSSGHRIYSRVVGRYSNVGFSRINSGNFGF